MGCVVSRRCAPLLLFGLVAGLVCGGVPVIAADAELLKEIAPKGQLRVAIAVAPTPSAFWSTKDASGETRGVPLELSRAMATKLGVTVTFVVFPSSGEIVKAQAARFTGHAIKGPAMWWLSRSSHFS